MTINAFGIITITRKEGAKFQDIKNISHSDTEQLLTMCLPFGDPHNKSLKLKKINNVFYIVLLTLQDKDEGIGILAPIDINHFTFNESFLINLSNILIENSNLQLKKQIILFHDFQYSSIQLGEIKNLENLLISILIGKKIYILDSNFKIFSLLENLFDLFPKELYFLLEFVINSNSFTENTKLISIPVTNENLENLDKLNKEKNTILDLNNNVCFGNYSSPVIKGLINNLSNNMVSSAREILLKLYITANNSDNVNENISKLSKILNLNKADINLILHLRKLLFKKFHLNHVFDELIT